MRISHRHVSTHRVGRSMLLALTVFYLGFHAVSGERGLYAWFKETRQLEALQAELAQVTAEREAYETKIRLLRADSLDLDMLDEQARRILGFVAEDEVVVLFTGQASKD